MRNSLLLAAIVGTFAAPAAVMAEEAAEATSPHTITYNIGLTSNYIFRGTSQSGDRPAIQGGVDYSHASGFYAGTWGSSISWLADTEVGDGRAYNSSSMEWDIYAGYTSEIGETGITYDVGVNQYIYPGRRNSVSGTYNADTTEIYGGLSYKWISGKYYWSPSKSAFGFQGRGASYVDLTLEIPFGESGYSAIAHVGRQEFGNGPNEFDYTDWKLGLSKAWDNGIVVGGYYTDTDADRGAFTYGPVFSGKENWTFFVQKTF
ncbi:hypothetical protein IHQ56_08690 [Methylobacillus flagellatus]|uniref:TorF family putative porin n=1 Tax=Methylobacillus flagellatus TaxID=405 RepID=UPI002853BAD4|nr:TorF family putative porin [Methylobacillus flagellatus]MDR5171891.1 hypothetical protein [Methylobacillus flagellatus]